MELHHSCILPSNAPALPEPEPYIPSRVLQERSANRLHEYCDDISPRERSPVYADRLAGHFTSSVPTHFSSNKTEAQIELETQRLMKRLKKCDKYQKYRERQPSSLSNNKNDKKEQRWPDHLEEAFFRGLVRYPPMGRRQLMHHGQLRGRNELVAASIEMDTGEPRDRKQVSSHIQVLKPMLVDAPQILVYMSKKDMSSRGGRGRLTNSHSRHRNASSKYGTSQANVELHQSMGYLPSSVALARIQSYEESPYTVANFDMFVEAADIREHAFSQISNSRSQLDDVYVVDSTTWHKQYPEFKFHQLEDFKDHHVLVCDATIKVMTTKTPPGAELKITFDLHSQCDLFVYDSIECHTRFFENGKLASQPDGETHTYEEYKAKHSIMHVHFGSGFWVQKMRKLGDLLSKASGQEELAARTNYTERVRGELQNMTASQDIYGVRDGEEVCLLTILWRFSQTRTSNDAGRMAWRVVNFGNRSDSWVKEEEMEHIRNAKELIPVSYAPTSLNMLTMPTSSQSVYPSIPLDYHQSFGGSQPPLDLDVLGLEAITAPDFSQPNSASSLVTDFSHAHSLPPLSHSQDLIGVSQSQDFTDINDFDFTSGHITISGCLEPAINLGTYDYAPPHPSTTLSLSLPALSSMSIHLSTSDQALTDLELSSLAGINAGMTTNCYATKPSWHHPSLISHLESAAEQFGVGDLMGTDEQGLMEGELWKLQAVFGGEDTGVGAEGRRDSKVSVGGEFGEGEGEGEGWRG